MRYRRIELDRVLQEGPDARLYVFTYRPDLTDLTSSIEKAGLLVAPVLREDRSGTCRVVCGWSRIQVLRSLDRKSVDAFVASERELTDAECLSRSILENRWHRGFNEVEKALLFTRLTDRFPDLLPGLTDSLGRDLKVPREAGALEPYRFLLSLSQPILDSVALGGITLAQALLLKRLPESARIPFFRIVTECGLTYQEARKALEWIREAAGRENRGETEILLDPAIAPCPGEAKDSRQKARLLLSGLSKRRHPLLEAWRDRFESARSGISARDKGIQVSHDPTFETTRVTVQFRAASELEFRQRLESLSEALRKGRIETLFDALSVEPGGSPKKI